MQLEVISNIKNEIRPAPILFVHGAWHAAWCWENFLPYFSQHGYAAHAVSLRGHGASQGRDNIRWHSAARGYVADVAQIAQTLTRPPILVGHSMGGYVVQKYLEIHTAAAGVLLASIPASGILGFGVRVGLRHPWPFLKAHVLLNLGHLLESPALMQAACYSPQVPAPEIARHFERLQPESFRMELETLFLDLPRPEKVRTPLLVLAAGNDRIFSVAEEQATARAYGTEAEIFPGMAHNMMLEPNWQQVADRILGWLQERGL
jgi:pimeloyl-ACP methyl ester carboxylesterase